MPVQRYDILPAVLSEPDGEYVRYEDYARYLAVVEAAKRLRDAENKRCWYCDHLGEPEDGEPCVCIELESDATISMADLVITLNALEVE